jgi:6-phosphofructokinase 1
MLEDKMEVFGIEDGYHGLVNNKYRKLAYNDVSGILTLGGTILGTSKIANPYRYPIKKGTQLEFKDLSKTAIRNAHKLGIKCLVCIGGDGTLGIANRLQHDGLNIAAVPKTIDNDIKHTEITFGFDSAVAVATEGIDRVHSTAQSHHRVMIVEVMGHNAGWIALHSGIAGGGDVILLPEIPYNMGRIVEKIEERNKSGKRFTIIVAAEGAKPKGGEVIIQRIVKESADPVRLGGIGFVLAEQIEKMTGIETRTVVLGYLQRGGSPTSFDRILATSLGAKAVELIQRDRFGYMAAVKQNKIVEVSLDKVAKGPRTVPLNHPLIQVARSVGTCFGD